MSAKEHVGTFGGDENVPCIMSLAMVTYCLHLSKLRKLYLNTRIFNRN